MQDSNGETYIEKRLHGHEERGGEGEMCGKSNNETCINKCQIDSNMEFAVWFRKHTQTLYQLAGWDGEGDRERFKREGIYVYLWLLHVEV